MLEKQNSSLICDLDSDSITSEKSVEDENWRAVLKVCQQNNPIPFGLQFSSWNYKRIEPIDSGSYSQVIKGFDTRINKEVVFKVINVISLKTSKKLCGISSDRQELLADVLNEIIVSKSLSNLHITTVDYRGHEFVTHSFPKIINASLVHGSIPNYFMFKPTDDTMDRLEPIKKYRELSGAPREYLVITMKHCGEPLWKAVKAKKVDAYQLLSICYQLTLALTVSEIVYQFEHRDLHLSNVLIKNTKKKYIKYLINTENYRVDSCGYKVTIIDTTFSRIQIGENTYFTSLTNRLKPCLLKKEPNIQGWVYQKMYKEANDDWQKWNPKTNMHWLRYFYKTLMISSIVNNCKDKKPKLILKELLDKITKYKTLEDFIKILYK